MWRVRNTTHGVRSAPLASVLHCSDGVTPQPDMCGPLRVAFVGAGRMARLHLHALRRVRSPHVVAAVCDTWDSAAREFAAQASAVAYPALADLLREVTPALVHVCTPAGADFEPARQALLAGAHVYVEKPFVETESEARELLAIEGERGLRVCAGHQQVCDPAFVGLIGPPRVGPDRADRQPFRVPAGGDKLGASRTPGARRPAPRHSAPPALHTDRGARGGHTRPLD